MLTIIVTCIYHIPFLPNLPVSGAATCSCHKYGCCSFSKQYIFCCYAPPRALPPQRRTPPPRHRVRFQDAHVTLRGQRARLRGGV